MNAAPPPLIDYWTVGFTGHRKLADHPKIAGSLAAELKSLREKIKGSLAAVSSVASGGDSLFAAEVLKQQIPWTALLPFPPEEFAKDFEPTAWQEAERCLSQALTVEIWSAAPDRPNAYHDVGIMTVDECDVLIAVWDGQHSHGKGGTSEMVAYAKHRKKPLIWIHSVDGTVIREHWGDAPLHDPIFESLLALPETENSKKQHSPLGAFFSRLDDAATAHLPRIRSQETRIVFYNSLAAFVAAYSLAMHYEALDFITLALLPMCAALFIMIRLHFSKARERFVQARLVAEICRSLQITKGFPDRLADLYRSSIPDFAHLIRSLLMARSVEKGPRSADASSDAALNAFREHYLKDRIRHQHGYYRRERQRSLPRASRYTWAAIIASAIAVISTLLLLIGGLETTRMDPIPAAYEYVEHHFLHRPDTAATAGPDSKLLALLTIAAPLIASFFTALLAVNEYGRRSARYREMEQLISDAEIRLTHSLTPRGIKQVIVETEAALLGENYQWYYHATTAERPG